MTDIDKRKPRTGTSNGTKESIVNQAAIANLLYTKAIKFIENRYPKGWGGAAVLRTVDNQYLTSVAVDTCNAGASLCIETGAICEAHKWDVAVTHSMCVVRDTEASEFKILTPCGICQERLLYWDDVYVGITTPDASLKMIALHELQPFHWTNAYNKGDLEFYANK